MPVFTRLGVFSLSKKKDCPVLWLHAASVGEAQSVSSLLSRLLKNNIHIVFTVQNIHTYNLLSKQYAKVSNVDIGFFPIDFWVFSSIAWQTIRPNLAILVDSELWPEHLYQAKKRKAPVWLINQRHSQRTYQRFERYPQIFLGLYAGLSKIWCGSKKDYNQVIRLGIDESKCYYHGNLKCMQKSKSVLTHVQKDALRAEIGFSIGSASIVLLAASSWPGEEEMLLEVISRLRNKGIDAKLIIVPRHPQRLQEFLPQIKKTGLSYEIRSQAKEKVGSNCIYIADTYGELGSFYQVSDVAFIGKSSMRQHGGQNPVEACAYGCAIVFGPNMQNFQDIANDLVHSEAAVQVNSNDEAIMVLEKIAQQDYRRKNLVKNAKKWIENLPDTALEIYKNIKAEILL